MTSGHFLVTKCNRAAWNQSEKIRKRKTSRLDGPRRLRWTIFPSPKLHKKQYGATLVLFPLTTVFLQGLVVRGVDFPTLPWSHASCQRFLEASLFPIELQVKLATVSFSREHCAVSWIAPTPWCFAFYSAFAQNVKRYPQVTLVVLTGLVLQKLIRLNVVPLANSSHADIRDQAARVRSVSPCYHLLHKRQGLVKGLGIHTSTSKERRWGTQEQAFWGCTRIR